jgi:magnesium-transporting ATPase (P-type)
VADRARKSEENEQAQQRGFLLEYASLRRVQGEVAESRVGSFYLFSCRSLTQSAWRIGMFTNRWIIVGVTVQTIGQLAITYLPAMNTVFGTAPIGGEVWLRIRAIAAAASLVVAVDKRLRRRA